MKQVLKVLLVFTGIFLAGAITGVFVFKAFTPPPRERPPRPTFEQFGRNQMESLAKKLELTEAQTEQLKPLFGKAQAELRSMSQESFRKGALVFERLNNELAAILTPEQKVRFETLRTQQIERMKKHIQQRGMPGPRKIKERQGPPPPLPPPENESLPSSQEPPAGA